MSEKKPCLYLCSILLVFTGFIFPHEGYAIPAAPILHKLTQPDGTIFNARQWGDESCHGWETEDGYSIIFDEDIQSWTYAIHDAQGELVSSSSIAVKDALPAGCTPHMRLTGSARSKIVRHMVTREIPAERFFRKEYPFQEEQAILRIVPSTGTANIPVILINFSDTTTTYTQDDFQTLLFGTGTLSMKDYYEEVSYGKYSVSGGPNGVVGWYTASKTHDYYGENKKKMSDRWVGDLVYEAVKAADEDVDFSAYDMDGDGYVDVVSIVHQGTDEAASGNSSDIWAHRSSLNDSKEYFGGNYGEYTTNDKNSKGEYIKINDYVMANEKTPDGTQETIGVFAHEYGHVLGLPDLYDTDSSSASIGYWSLMASGPYNSVKNSGDLPAHLDAWCKYYLGWITPTEVKGTLTDEPITQAATTADVYQLLDGTPLSGEYFLVENRQKSGFDGGIPGEGLLIWHIDGKTIKKKKRKNTVNDSECYPPDSCPLKHYGVTLMQADGKWDLEKGTNYGDDSDPYPGLTENTSLTGNSSPSSKPYKKKKKEVSITNISASGPTMTATLSIQSK